MRWLAIIPLTIALGLLLDYFHVPAAWVLAGILAAGLVAIATSQLVLVEPRVSDFGRGFIAILAAMPLLSTTPGALVPFILPALVVTFVSVGTSVAAGLAIARLQSAVKVETGLLATRN